MGKITNQELSTTFSTKILGGITNPSDMELNNYIESGRYTFGNLEGALHFPDTTESGLLVVDNCGVYVLQTYRTATSLYTRRRGDGGVWSIWDGKLYTVSSPFGTVTGGYIRQGKAVLVNVKFVNSTTTTAYSQFIQGLPSFLVPVTGFTITNGGTGAKVGDAYSDVYGAIINVPDLVAGTYIISGTYITT